MTSEATTILTLTADAPRHRLRLVYDALGRATETWKQAGYTALDPDPDEVLHTWAIYGERIADAAVALQSQRPRPLHVRWRGGGEMESPRSGAVLFERGAAPRPASLGLPARRRVAARELPRSLPMAA